MSRSPLYERVESVLAGDIADGSLPPETQLPPEEGLIERFKVSRTTVRKAIQNLVERGLVEVRRGRGTFVTQPKITQERGHREAARSVLDDSEHGARLEQGRHQPHVY